MLKIRSVTDEDCRLLWEWVNGTNVRSSAFQSDPIVWEDHVSWFRTKRSDPNCHIYVLLDQKNTPIGQVRFDLQTDSSALIDISIDRQYCGRGYGGEALTLSCKQFFRETKIPKAIAAIKLNNYASLRAFEKAGFQKEGKKLIKGEEAIVMSLTADHEIDRNHIR